MSEMKAAQQSSTSVVSANVRQQQRDGEMEIDLGELFLRLLVFQLPELQVETFLLLVYFHMKSNKLRE
jgi:hypothetical protein